MPGNWRRPAAAGRSPCAGTGPSRWSKWWRAEIAELAHPGAVRHGRASPRPGFRLRRPLSLYAVRGDRLGLLVEARGPGSERLADVEVGEALELAGPLGTASRSTACAGPFWWGWHRLRAAAVPRRRVRDARRAASRPLRLSRRAPSARRRGFDAIASGSRRRTAASGAADWSTDLLAALDVAARRRRSSAAGRCHDRRGASAGRLDAGARRLRLTRGAHGLRGRGLPRLCRGDDARRTCASAARVPFSLSTRWCRHEPGFDVDLRVTLGGDRAGAPAHGRLRHVRLARAAPAGTAATTSPPFRTRRTCPRP